MNDPPPNPPSRQPTWQQPEDQFAHADHVMQSHQKMAPALFEALLSASRKLLALAQQLSTGSETDRQLAVIFSQTACDLHMEQAMGELLAHRATVFHGHVKSILGRDVSLNQERVRNLYFALTGDRPWGGDGLAAEPWWKAWKVDRDFRNAVAHQGHSVTAIESARCIDSAVAHMDHVSRVVSATLANPP